VPAATLPAPFKYVPNAGVPDSGKFELTDEARKAIREMGTKAVPKLIEWIEYEPFRFRRWLWDVVQPLPRRVRPNFLRPDEFRVEEAEAGFRALGPMAACAIPRLRELALSTNELTRVHGAINCLAYIGSEAAPALFDVVEQAPRLPFREEHLRFYALVGIASLEGGRPPIQVDGRPEFVALLLELMRSENERLAAAAALAAGRIDAPPAVLIGQLVRMLESDVELRRLVASNSLKRRAPELLTNAAARVRIEGWRKVVGRTNSPHLGPLPDGEVEDWNGVGWLQGHSSPVTR
jgi:hypothetical protein